MFDRHFATPQHLVNFWQNKAKCKLMTTWGSRTFGTSDMTRFSRIFQYYQDARTALWTSNFFLIANSINRCFSMSVLSALRFTSRDDLSPNLRHKFESVWPIDWDAKTLETVSHYWTKEVYEAYWRAWWIWHFSCIDTTCGRARLECRDISAVVRNDALSVRSSASALKEITRIRCDIHEDWTGVQVDAHSSRKTHLVLLIECDE